MSLKSSLILLLLSCFLSIKLNAQPLLSRHINPIVEIYDGCVERYMGQYYALGTGTMGNIYSSKNLTTWIGPTFGVPTNEATWLNNPKWTQSYTYKRVGAGDILYRNGVFHVYYNGIGHSYSAKPLGLYKENSIERPFDDYGIDTQVFQDEDGEIYYIKKRNKEDPNPITGAPSNISGPEVWIFRMNSPFVRQGIPGAVQITHQVGHPTNINLSNFEGPELFKHRSRYYMFFSPNRMGVQSGLYQIGVAESDAPMNFSNSKKYPNPVLFRNTEQHLVDYRLLLNTAEHGGWSCKFQTTIPSGEWTKLDYDDTAWLIGTGGFGRQQIDLNTIIRATKTIWNTNKIYIRRKFNLKEIPQKTALKYWVFANADFYINGNKITINTTNPTYCNMDINPSFFVKGENVISVEAASPCTGADCEQFIDFGLFDTNGLDVENTVLGQSQANFVVGPNGFERWLMYKAFFGAKSSQGIDRIHFYNNEVVVENSTIKNTIGYRPKPALPTMINYFDYPIYYPFKMLNGSKWKILGGILYSEDTNGGELLLLQDSAFNYRFEVPFRINESIGMAGVYAYYEDSNNWLKIQICKEKKWKIEKNSNGVIQVIENNLPLKFEFLENNSLVSQYNEPWHTLTIYKNGSNFKVELDYFNLTLNSLIETNFNKKGLVGLLASSNNVSFDAVQFTYGWDEYSTNISGWGSDKGNWNISTNGLTQSDFSGISQAFKGDSAWNYEFSVYMKNSQLPFFGKAGYYPLYIDSLNYVRAVINYETKSLEIGGKEKGNPIENQTFSLRNQILKYYTFQNYPTTNYQYNFRNESLISGVNILWFEGNYPYLSQNFDLPQDVRFYALQNGSWILLNSILEGNFCFSYMNHFTFPSVKTTAIKMEVVNKAGKTSRAFSAYFDEEVAGGYFLRCRRDNDGLHIFIDDKYKALVNGKWGKSVVGLYTENLPVTFNGFLHYQSGGVGVKSITIDKAICAVGESIQLTTNIQPINATNQNLVWSSSNSDIVSVDEKGFITRHLAGKATITAFTADGGGAKGSVEILETGLNVKKNTLNFQIYPIPASDYINFHSVETVKEISIYSLSGEKLKTYFPNDSHSIKIDFLQSGMYLIAAKTENNLYSKMFSVIKK